LLRLSPYLHVSHQLLDGDQSVDTTVQTAVYNVLSIGGGRGRRTEAMLRKVENGELGLILVALKLECASLSAAESHDELERELGTLAFW